VKDATIGAAWQCQRVPEGETHAAWHSLSSSCAHSMIASAHLPVADQGQRGVAVPLVAAAAGGQGKGAQLGGPTGSQWALGRLRSPIVSSHAKQAARPVRTRVTFFD
jgi:hypothetical protein